MSTTFFFAAFLPHEQGVVVSKTVASVFFFFAFFDFLSFVPPSTKSSSSGIRLKSVADVLFFITAYGMCDAVLVKYAFH